MIRLGITAASAEEVGLAGRLAWITALRLGFLLVLLTATSFLYLHGELGGHPASSRFVLGTIAAAFALGGAYGGLLRTGKRLKAVAHVQLVFDQLTWTAIVYVSGGATSGATSFYALTCLVGAILVGLRGAAVAATTGTALYALLCLGFSLGWVEPPPDQAAASYAISFDEIIYPLLVNLLGIGVVALLAGYLAERLRLTGGALEEAQQRVVEAERLAAIGRLATGLAHEIRNPLGSISGSIEMLRESPALSQEDKQLCDIVRREAARLNNLVTDMMDYARPRAPVPEDVDVAALAREVVALAALSERSGAGDVSVVFDGPNEARAFCDPARIRQVLWNLVRNAVQASAAGTAVCVRVEPAAGHILLAVDDRGPGISEESRQRIFDPYYTTRAHGTGIGLAVVKRIIDDHGPVGARILVESPASGGASFQVFLRRAGEIPEPAKRAPSIRPRPA